jgi:hypothetical protein
MKPITTSELHWLRRLYAGDNPYCGDKMADARIVHRLFTLGQIDAAGKLTPMGSRTAAEFAASEKVRAGKVIEQAGRAAGRAV